LVRKKFEADGAVEASKVVKSDDFKRVTRLLIQIVIRNYQELGLSQQVVRLAVLGGVRRGGARRVSLVM
jgi:hypothetical protein